MYIADHNGQLYVVIHFDQALYYKLMELKLIIAQYRERLIVGLGGLHIIIHGVSSGHRGPYERIRINRTIGSSWNSGSTHCRESHDMQGNCLIRV